MTVAAGNYVWNVSAPLDGGAAQFVFGGPNPTYDFTEPAIVDVVQTARLDGVPESYVRSFTRRFVLSSHPQRAELAFEPATDTPIGRSCDVHRLRAGDCCLPRLKLRLLDHVGDVSTSERFEHHQVYLHIESDGVASFLSGFAEPLVRGVATFDHLVIRVKKAGKVIVTLKGISADWNFRGPVRLEFNVNENTCAAVKPFVIGVPRPADNDPILIIMPVHECPECVAQSMANINRFLPNSVMFIHCPTLNSGWEKLLNGTHPRLFFALTPLVSFEKDMLHDMFFAMMDQAMQDTRLPKWSHALLQVSNEMWVRSGVYEYIKQHDMPVMTAPAPNAGLLYDAFINRPHSGNRFNFHSLVTEDEVLEHIVYPPYLHWHHSMAYYTQDFKLRKMMYEFNLTKFSRSFVLAEGTYFSRRVLEKYIMPRVRYSFTNSRLCGRGDVYPVIEIHPPTMYQDLCAKADVKCGQRVSTMAWTSVQEIWVAQREHVWRCACGPTIVPFGLKRIPRDLRHGTRKEVLKLQNMTDAEIEEYCRTVM